MLDRYLIPIALLLGAAPVLAGDAPPVRTAPSFDGRRAMAVISEISSDAYGGRKSGVASGQRAEAYAAERFTAAGLEPVGERGTYFQTLPMLATEERGATLELLDSPYGTVSFLYGDDFALVTNSGSGDITGEVVFVGHGLCDPQREWDDYGDTDVSGKLVLIVRGKPENGFDWEQADSRDSTLHEASRRGAVAVLYSQGPRPVHGGAVHDGSYYPRLPSVYVGHRVVELLLMNTGRTRELYERELGERPVPFATGKRVRVRTDVARVPDACARNVIAQLPGSDPRLRTEIIVLGAHLDHLGTDGRGLVYNGANDNASGAAIVMELARALAQGPGLPARTLVFAAFAGEEQGLLGSQAMAEHPTIDLDRVVAMINFDMTGHGNGTVGIGGGESFPSIWRSFRAGLDSTSADSLFAGRAWGGEGSDHAPFRKAGIPTGNIWSEGDHRFYHSIQDDAAWIDTLALGSLGRMAERWIRYLADWPEPLACEHRAGRALLRGSHQVDFDGVLPSPLPDWVHAQVHWFDADLFSRGSYLDLLGALEAAGPPGIDTLTVIDALHEIDDAVWGGQRAQLLGLRHAGTRVPAERMSLLGDLHAALACWPVGMSAATVKPPVKAAANGSGAVPDDGYLRQLTAEGVTLLVPADTLAIGRVPPGARVCVRFFPQRDEQWSDPDPLPRKGSLVVVSLDRATGPRQIAEALRRIGWDRVHLDLVPCLSRADERAIWAFLEDLQAAGNFEVRQLRAMLGDNLARL